MHNGLRLLYFLCVLLFISLSPHRTAAQSPPDVPGELIYTRYIDDHRQIVWFSSQNRLAHDIQDGDCVAESTYSHHVAVTNCDNPQDLTIFDSETGEQVFQYPWDSRWAVNDFRWHDANALRIRDDSNDNFDYFIVENILTGTYTQYLEPPSPLIPELPDRVPDSEIFPSSNNTYVVYRQCSDSLVSTSDGPRCLATDAWVIYDTVQQESAVIPGGLTAEIVGGTFLFHNSVKWSPSARYLAYIRSDMHDFTAFPLDVYDLQEDRRLGGDFSLVTIDSVRGLHWSPAETMVAFWVVGCVCEDYNPEVRSLIIYDLTIEKFRFTEAIYENPSHLIWSPNSQMLAFINSDNQLIHVDAVSGATSILDEQVSSLKGWRSLDR